MGVGALLRKGIDAVLQSKMHPVAKGAIVLVLFAGVGAATYFGMA